jgi:Tfp pilus assembly protein PilN
MRKSFLSLFILFSLTATAQKTNKFEDLQKNIAKQRAELDSMQKVNDSMFKVRMKRSDSIERARFNEQNTRNLNSFVKSMQERDRKQKRAMWMRLGLGVLMLGVLIFGLLRRRKKKEIQ